MTEVIVPASDSAPQWFSASARLLVKRCGECSRLHHYPRPLCPFCMSDATEWLEVAGTGSIYTFTTARQKDGAFVIAFVTLDEGISIMTHIVDCDPAQLAIGRRVRMVQRELNGQTVPVFQPLP